MRALINYCLRPARTRARRHKENINIRKTVEPAVDFYIFYLGKFAYPCSPLFISGAAP